MNDLFNILIFSKDYNQGVIIQDYIKAIGYNSQVFDQEEAAYEGFLSRNFTLCIICLLYTSSILRNDPECDGPKQYPGLHILERLSLIHI